MSDILILPVSSTLLVFGLEWLPLISGRARHAANRIARQHRATHLVFPGDSAAAVGLATLGLTRAQRKQTFNSAAQNVARLFSTGTVAVLLELEAGNHWLVAVHEGAVVARTDKLYCSMAEATVILDELKLAYPQLVLVGTPGAPGPLTLTMIVAASDAYTQLAPVSGWRSSLPKPVQWFVLALALVLLLPRMWNALSPAFATAAPVHPVDPYLAWKDTMDKASRTRLVHGVQGTRSLLHSLYELPIQISGWFLINAACVPEFSEWRCLARYDRRDPDSSNDSLLTRAPSGWSVEFISIEQAQPVWRIKSMGLPLAAHYLKSTAQNERQLFSSLQAIRPAFTVMQLGKPQPLKIAAPRDDKGRVIPKPDDLPNYLTRSVQIAGPLRSGSLLLPYTESVSWQKVSVFLHDINQVGLKSSRINVSFQGELYEIESVQKESSEPVLYDRDPANASFAQAFKSPDSPQMP